MKLITYLIMKLIINMIMKVITNMILKVMSRVLIIIWHEAVTLAAPGCLHSSISPHRDPHAVQPNLCTAHQCNAHQCNAQQCNALHCNRMHSAHQCNAMQCSMLLAMLCNPTPAMHCTPSTTIHSNLYELKCNTLKQYTTVYPVYDTVHSTGLRSARRMYACVELCNVQWKSHVCRGCPALLLLRPVWLAPRHTIYILLRLVLSLDFKLGFGVLTRLHGAILISTQPHHLT